MSRVGRVGSDINIRVKFYASGVLFDPFDISNVLILDASEGGNTLASLPPNKISTGIYEITWSVPNVAAGRYYDEWTWTAVLDFPSKTQTYSFRIDAALPSPSVVEDNIPLTGGPLFVGTREIDFFDSITKELIQKIVSQKVFYYPVSAEHTKTNELYDEAIRKTVYTPVEIKALILYNEPNQTVSQFSYDTIYSIEVYFHIHELKERNIIPREGDFVKFGKIMYEIEKLVQPQIVYGQIDEKVMLKATCRVSRKSQFEVFDGIPAQPED
jgi:hypothetical protein